MNKKSITREPKNHEKDWTHPISLWPPFLSCQANPCLLWCLDILVQEFHPLRFSAMNHAHWFSREGLNTPFSSQVKWCILFYNNFPKMSYYSAVRLAYKLCEWFCRSLFQIKFTRRVYKMVYGADTEFRVILFINQQFWSNTRPGHDLPRWFMIAWVC